MTASRTLLVGGLGSPHDALVAAAVSASGHAAEALGAPDADALELGRASLPRGQCAPLLFTTGTLLREARARRGSPLAYLGVRSCGPCRYALFEPAWERALAEDGHSDVRIVSARQSAPELAALLGTGALLTALDAIAVADVLRETSNRLRPHVVDPDALERRARDVATRIAARIAGGEAPAGALERERGWHRGLARRPTAPLARAALIGEPWSLHVDGEGQLHLPDVLARAGVEVEVPPVALFVRYVLWQARAHPWAAALDRRVCDAAAAAARAAGVGGFEIPSPDELARHAAPWLPGSLTGGYGHVEIGLAARARAERRAHLVLSVKSFGCVPSSGVSDAIVPAVLGREVAFLSLEVCGDGDAARESRLMLRIAGALEAAEAEVRDALRARGASGGSPALLVSDPLSAAHQIGARPYACTLACDFAAATGASTREGAVA